MSDQQIQAWATRMPIAVAGLTKRPDLLLGVKKMAGMARALNPSLPTDELTELALFVLAWEFVSAAPVADDPREERSAA